MVFISIGNEPTNTFDFDMPESKIDKKWIKRARKSWKRFYKRSKKVNGLQEIEKLLDDVDKFLTNFYEDLVFNKGLYPYDEMYAYRQDEVSKFVEPLEDARQEINGLQNEIEIFRKRDVDVDFEDQTEEVFDKVDSLVSRKSLGRMTREVNKLEEAINKDPIPVEYSVGDLKVIYQGLPGGDVGRAEHLMQHFDDVDFDPRKPAFLEDILDSVREAYGLIKRRDLGEVWYGIAFIDSGRAKGSAKYMPGKDRIRIYDVISPRILIHELGHRYWYKILSKRGRAMFRDTFSEDDSITEYGGKNPEEDFAEMFAEYVMGGSIPQDQIERFNKVITANTTTLKNQLIKLGSQEKSLRPNIRVILDKI